MCGLRPLIACALLVCAGLAQGCGDAGRGGNRLLHPGLLGARRRPLPAAIRPAPPGPPPAGSRRSLNPHDVYAADRPGRLSPAVRGFPSRVYVPNSESNTVSVIDPRTFKVIDSFPVGALPQHVTPSYDLKTLWVDNDQGNSLTPIDPATGRPGKPVPVADPYNLYFTPDGRYAIVVAERLQRLDFRDAADDAATPLPAGALSRG